MSPHQTPAVAAAAAMQQQTGHSHASDCRPQSDAGFALAICAHDTLWVSTAAHAASRCCIQSVGWRIRVTHLCRCTGAATCSVTLLSRSCASWAAQQWRFRRRCATNHSAHMPSLGQVDVSDVGVALTRRAPGHIEPDGSASRSGHQLRPVVVIGMNLSALMLTCVLI